MKMREIRELSTEELIAKIKEEKERLAKMKLVHAVQPIENPMRIRYQRKLIARLLTELNHRRQEQKQGGKSQQNG